MGTNITITNYDIALLIVVAAQATLGAYLYKPKWKAFLLVLPIPFSLVTLSLGNGVDVANVAGLTILLIYTHAVRLLNYTFKLPIIPSIVIGSIMFCVISSVLNPILPRTETFFWTMCIFTVLLAIVMDTLIPPISEPGHRSPLPLWMKFPTIAVVIFCLVLMKKYLGGFMTVFPMVGVITSFEARHSLWTICREIPWAMLLLLPMMISIKYANQTFSLPISLLIGWVVFLTLLFPLTILHRRLDQNRLKGVFVKYRLNEQEVYNE